MRYPRVIEEPDVEVRGAAGVVPAAADGVIPEEVENPEEQAEQAETARPPWAISTVSESTVYAPPSVYRPLLSS